MMSRLSVCLIVIVFSSWFQHASANDSAELYRLINQRLSLMKEVALYKAINHLSVEDMEREKVVLENSIENAVNRGLDSESVVDFFTTQILVAKAIQYRIRADILSNKVTRETSPLELNSVIRPQLLRLGGEIVEQMKTHLEIFGSFMQDDRDLFYSHILVAYLTEKEKELIFQSILNIKLTESK